MLPRIGFMPDVLHLNDWQTAMAAPLLKLQYASEDPAYSRVRTLLTIHNLRYQGIFDSGFMDELLSLGAPCFDPHLLEYNGCINFLKGGIVYADRISTVSPTYAREILTPYYGEGLDGVLREREHALTGLLNGIDTAYFNPADDPALPACYALGNMAGKAACKAALQRELGLAERPDVPVAALVSRLTDQKGLDLLEHVLAEIMEQELQLVVLGTGDARYEQLFSWASWRYGSRFAAHMAYNEGLAHRVYAGADLFLMPSRFEPCGLSQMIALRYGAVPVVRETGGLVDSVESYNRFTDAGVGFSFLNYNAHELLFTIQHAVAYYHGDKDLWARLVQRGMACDFPGSGRQNSMKRCTPKCSPEFSKHSPKGDSCSKVFCMIPLGRVSAPRLAPCRAARMCASPSACRIPPCVHGCAFGWETRSALWRAAARGNTTNFCFRQSIPG